MQRQPSKRMKVLLIDDDPLFGHVMERKAAGFDIDLSYSESLLEAMYENYLKDFDVLIVDCVMPQLTGFEISRYFSTFLAEIPVVLVSQSQKSFERFLSDSNGAAVFVAKDQGAAAIFAAARGLVALGPPLKSSRLEAVRA